VQDITSNTDEIISSPSTSPVPQRQAGQSWSGQLSEHMRKPTPMQSGVKPSTLGNCFEGSQVKIHGPSLLLVDVDNVQEVEDDILDCIRVAQPTLQLP